MNQKNNHPLYIVSNWKMNGSIAFIDENLNAWVDVFKEEILKKEDI